MTHLLHGERKVQVNANEFSGKSADDVSLISPPKLITLALDRERSVLQETAATRAEKTSRALDEHEI